jgi:hypothetical protein
VVLPVEKFAANGELSLNCLSHPRGQPHGSTLERASGAFAEVIVRTIFGFPDAVEGKIQASTMVPGFERSLKNVRYRGRLLTITIPRTH